jgi:hypothetical protein
LGIWVVFDTLDEFGKFLDVPEELVEPLQEDESVYKEATLQVLSHRRIFHFSDKVVRITILTYEFVRRVVIRIRAPSTEVVGQGQQHRRNAVFRKRVAKFVINLDSRLAKTVQKQEKSLEGNSLWLPLRQVEAKGELPVTVSQALVAGLEWDRLNTAA